MDHREEVGGKFVIAGGNATEALQLREEPLDQVALAVESLAKAGRSLPVGLGRDTLILDHLAYAIRVIGLVGQHDGARAEVIQQAVDDLPVVRLPCGQAEPDRETLRVDDYVDLSRKPASRAAETMIWTPFFAGAACWCARMEVLSIIWIRHRARR